MPEPPGQPPSRPAAPVAGRVLAWLRATGVRPALVASGVGAALALAAVAFVVLRPAPGPPPELSLPFADPPGATSAVGAPGRSSPAPEVVVHAAGAVARPGVYRLASTARVTDVVEAAGGPAPDADLDRVNLAATVADGERVYVPRRGEAVPPVGDTGAGSESGGAGVLDLNTASADELEALPGVGPSTARAIVEHRTRQGRFRSVDDLLDVRGIGPAKLAQIRPHVRV